MMGNWLRASLAAFCPSSTSCETLYLFAGGVIFVCAETSELASAIESDVIQNRLFMFLSFVKKRIPANNCQPIFGSDAICQSLTHGAARNRSVFQHLAPILSSA